MNNKSSYQAPHTAIGVHKLNTLQIPDRIYFVYIVYNQYSDKMFHKRFDTPDEALAYISKYKDTIDGKLIFKEYFSVPAITVPRPIKLKKKVAVSSARSSPIKSDKLRRGVRK